MTPHLLLVPALLALVAAAPPKPQDEKSISALRDALIALSPQVKATEAELVSIQAHRASRRLAREYRMTGPPVFQNFLIYTGFRQRGYCYHFARDIGADLKLLKLQTLVLHWGASHARTYLENN